MRALALKTCGVAPRARRWKAGEGVAGHSVIASAPGYAAGSKANLGRLPFGCCFQGRGAELHVRSQSRPSGKRRNLRARTWAGGDDAPGVLTGAVLHGGAMSDRDNNRTKEARNAQSQQSDD